MKIGNTFKNAAKKIAEIGVKVKISQVTIKLFVRSKQQIVVNFQFLLGYAFQSILLGEQTDK